MDFEALVQWLVEQEGYGRAQAVKIARAHEAGCADRLDALEQRSLRLAVRTLAG